MYDSSHLMVRNALRIGGSTSVSSFGLRLGYRFQQRAVLAQHHPRQAMNLPGQTRLLPDS